MNGQGFPTYLEIVLVPRLSAGGIVVMDNLAVPQDCKRANANRSR
jgi:transposase